MKGSKKPSGSKVEFAEQRREEAGAVTSSGCSETNYAGVLDADQLLFVRVQHLN